MVPCLRLPLWAASSSSELAGAASSAWPQPCCCCPCAGVKRSKALPAEQLEALSDSGDDSAASSVEQPSSSGDPPNESYERTAAAVAAAPDSLDDPVWAPFCLHVKQSRTCQLGTPCNRTNSRGLSNIDFSVEGCSERHFGCSRRALVHHIGWFSKAVHRYG